jgi:hypothetical protein
MPSKLAKGIANGLMLVTWSTQVWADGMVPQNPVGTQGSQGSTGATGAAASIAVGTVTTLSPGNPATIVNAGSTSAAVFNFGIPQGAIGPAGSTGLAGTQFTSTQLTTNTAGAVTWTYPVLCNSSSKFWAQPIVNTTGTLVNVQNLGQPNSSTQVFQVNVTNFSTVALLGLTILSVPASPGSTVINAFCQPP